MQKLLTKIERQRLADFYKQGDMHPLFLACEDVFMSRAAKLERVKAEGEDVFCCVAFLLDLFMSKKRAELVSQKEVDDSWSNLLKDIREWPDSTVNDRIIIANTVFRILRKLMCHHWDLRFSISLYEMLGITMARESKEIDDEEQQRTQNRLSTYSDSLSEWINNEYNGYLSGEIETIIKGKGTGIRTIKLRSGRKAKDVKNIVETFNYQPRLDDRGQRLQVFYNSLKGRFIDIKTQQKDFIDIFQNTTTTAKIVWIREKILLKYFILQTEKYLSLPSGYTKWQIVCAHFQVRVKHKVANEGKKDECYLIEDLTPAQFTKGGKIPQSYEELDRIIRILNPKINYEESLQDYLDYQQEHDDKMDVKDALANRLSTDLRV